MDVKIIALVVVFLLCCSLAGFLVWRTMKSSSKQDKETPAVMMPVPPPTPSPSPSPPQTEPPLLTTAPPETARPDVFVYAPGSWGYYHGGAYPGGVPGIPRYHHRMWPEIPRPIQPGGSWPELMGKDKDDATAYVMSTYPNMHVAVVRYGAPMPTDYRTDRFVLVYDAYTRKVVGAAIG